MKNQRIAKEIYRQKKIKEAKDKAIIHSEPSHSQSPSSSSTFFHPSTKARCLRKVASTLRKSPGKKMKIVKSLAKQFKLKIKYDNQPKVERPKNNLADDDVECLRVFFERPDITYTLLGTKDQKCTGKVNGESMFVQKRYLPWTLGEIVDILNGRPSTGTVGFKILWENKSSVTLWFCQKSFRVWDVPHSNCLCEICDNVVYLSKTLAQNDKDLPSNPHDLVEKFSCDSSKQECMYTNECDVCNLCISA